MPRATKTRLVYPRLVYPRLVYLGALALIATCWHSATATAQLVPDGEVCIVNASEYAVQLDRAGQHPAMVHRRHLVRAPFYRDLTVSVRVPAENGAERTIELGRAAALAQRSIEGIALRTPAILVAYPPPHFLQRVREQGALDFDFVTPQNFRKVINVDVGSLGAKEVEVLVVNYPTDYLAKILQQHSVKNDLAGFQSDWWSNRPAQLRRPADVEKQPSTISVATLPEGQLLILADGAPLSLNFADGTQAPVTCVPGPVTVIFDASGGSCYAFNYSPEGHFIQVCAVEPGRRTTTTAAVNSTWKFRKNLDQDAPAFGDYKVAPAPLVQRTMIAVTGPPIVQLQIRNHHDYYISLFTRASSAADLEYATFLPPHKTSTYELPGDETQWNAMRGRPGPDEAGLDAIRDHTPIETYRVLPSLRRQVFHVGTPSLTPAPNTDEAAQQESEFDYSNAAKEVVTSALSLIPEGGELLGAITGVLWDAGENVAAADGRKKTVWEQVKNKTEAMVDGKIDQLVLDQTMEYLQGLKNNLDAYLDAVDDPQPNPQFVAQKYSALISDFNQQQPHFKSEKHKVALLPLFAQFANLHLATLREGVIHGKSWGYSDHEQKSAARELTRHIEDYSSHVESTFQEGLDARKQKTDPDGDAITKFNIVHDYIRENTIYVLDFQQRWKYFDVTKYPTPITPPPLEREVYIAFGSSSADIELPKMPPKKSAASVDLLLRKTKESRVVGSHFDWSTWQTTTDTEDYWQTTDYIQDIVVKYDGVGQGPDGKDLVAGGWSYDGGGITGNVHHSVQGPVTGVRVWHGTVIDQLQLYSAADNQWGPVVGKLGGKFSEVSFAGHELSSVMVVGMDFQYQTMSAIVLGFKLSD